MSASLAMLEVKYQRAMTFGEYLEQHPDQSPLDKELKRSLMLYRIALHNVLQDRIRQDADTLNAVSTSGG